MVTRINRGLDAVAGHSLFPTQIGIAIPLNQPRPDGLPDGEEQKVLYQIEDWIRAELAAENRSLFVGVITTSGMREFVLYTSDEEAATEKIRNLVDRTKSHEVQYIVKDDAEWAVYKALSGQA